MGRANPRAHCAAFTLIWRFNAPPLHALRSMLKTLHRPSTLCYPFPMDSLHAPWRIEYILAAKTSSPQTFFTQIAQSNDDEANLVIARDRTCYALLNAYPYTGGHLMIVPYKQVRDMNGLTDEEMTDLMKLTRRCQNALTKVMKPDGVNIGSNLGKVAGAGILEHLHIHIVPRWLGDTNFMPVLANTMVVPQALKDLAAQLRAALAT